MTSQLISGYPQEHAVLGYQPKPVEAQVARLREVFPELGSADMALANRPLPESGAEALFAIPRLEKIASTPVKAMQRVFDAFENHCPWVFTNSTAGQKISLDRFSRCEHTIGMLERLGKQQFGHDILIVPAQFGLLHRNQSVSDVRVRFSQSEFGLSAFEVAVKLLVHPERLQKRDDLAIDCPGDDYDWPSLNAAFGGENNGAQVASRFSCRGSSEIAEVSFSTEWFGAYGCSGAATGFVY
jgi:hypothetical protein